MMTNNPINTNINRFDRVKAALVSAATQPSEPLLDNLNLLTSARFTDLMLTDRLRAVGEDSKDRLGEILEGINDSLLPSSDADTLDTNQAVIAKRAVYEVMDLNKTNPVGGATRNNDAIQALLKKTDGNKAEGIISLSKQQVMFDNDVLNEIPDIVAFLKGDEDDITDSELAQISLVANDRLDQDKRLLDSGLNAGSFANFLNHKSFEAIFHRISHNPALASLMYDNLGEPFELSLYHQATKEGNSEYAMKLLSHSKHGLLKDSKHSTANNPQVKNLMQLVVKADGSEANINKLVDTATTPESLDVMLESLVDVHNSHYNSQNLANILDKVGAGMTSDQLKRFGEVLVKSYQQQPVLPALQKILDISSDKGFEFSHLERATVHIRDELNQDYQELKQPLSSYSATTIDFSGVNMSIALRDAKTLPHLQSMINQGLSGYNGAIDYEVNGSGSLLDETTKEALVDYFSTNNIEKLNDLMTKPLRSAEKDKQKWAQLLFESNKQNKSLPPLALDDVNTLSDIVDKDAAVYSNGKKLIDLSEMRTSNDFTKKISDADGKSLSMDETGLGKDYDKKLLSTLRDVTDSPSNKQKQSELNDYVGLPVTELSSKIENQQENNQKSGNIIKKAIDSLGAATSSLRQPQ